jgi:hypothetical protein
LNFIFGIVCLFECVCAFSLHRESPDMISGDKPLIFEVVLSQYPNPNDNYQAPYTTVAYTDPIPLHGSSLGFLPNHAYQSMPRSNAYDHLEAGGFGYETPPQFLFRPQSIHMMPARATAEPGVDPNNLTN